MGRYRVISKTVEAVKWTGNNLPEILSFAGTSHMARVNTKPEVADSLEYFDIVNKDWFHVPTDEWLVRDENGVVTLMENEEFLSTFEPITTHRGNEGMATPPSRSVPRDSGQRRVPRTPGQSDEQVPVVASEAAHG